MTPNLQNPVPVLITDPINLDKAIQAIQTRLINRVAWFNGKVFGRARDVIYKDTNGKAIREPWVYLSASEYYPCWPNDALQAFSFFRTTGPHINQDYAPGSIHSTMTKAVDCITWVNLNAIDSSKDYIYTEELIQEQYTALIQTGFVEITRVYDERMEEIYKGYTLSDSHRDLLIYPYAAWRFEMIVNFEFCAE